MPKPKSQETTTNAIVRHASTQELRDAFRQSIIGHEIELDLQPIQGAVLKKAVRKPYATLLKNALERGEEYTVQVHLQKEAVKAHILANAANRDRTMSHVEDLALDFRVGKDEHGNEVEWNDPDSVKLGFEPTMTHVVVSESGLNQDGGHSTMAFAVAFFPKSFFECEEFQYTETAERTNEEGETETYEVTKYRYPAVSGDFPWLTEEESEEILERYKDQLFYNLVLNSPSDVCRKLADKRLNMTVAMYLKMIPQVRWFIEELGYGIDISTIESFIRGWYLRSLCKTVKGTGGKEDYVSYGAMNKGGRPNNAESPAWLLAIAPKLQDAITELVAASGDGKNIFFSENIKKSDGSCQVPQYAMLIALCSCETQEQMARLAKALTSDSAYTKQLRPHVVKPDSASSTDWQKKPTWWLVHSMVAFAKGLSASKAVDFPVRVEKDETHPQQEVDMRAGGWDSFSTECDELRDQTIADCGVSVGELIGATDELAASLNRKVGK